MQLSYNNKFKPKVVSSYKTFYQQNKLKIKTLSVLLILLFLILFKIVSPNGKFSNYKRTQYPKLHGFYKNEIFTSKPLIFPTIEDAPLLRELSINGLFKFTLDSNKNVKEYLLPESYDSNESEDEDELNSKINENNHEINQMLKVKKNFHKEGRLLYNKNLQSPDIIIVTAIDFEKYEVSQLKKIVSNRIDYAKNHQYGVYIRWIQEFLPFYEINNGDLNYKKFAKLSLLRSAMYAFPNAKYFWYLDEDGLIMRYDVDLFKYLLDPKALDPIMLRDQSIIPPNGIIKTFKNSKASSMDLILTQIDSDLNLNSIIVKNSFIIKSLLEFWNDKLFRTYHNFPKYLESSLTHILQWHPIFLSKTAIIPPRTIASFHNALNLKDEDDLHYFNNDFVVSLRDCEFRQSCDKEIDYYWGLLQK